MKRLHEKLDKDGDCWLWTGSAHRGYGKIQINHQPRYVHRISYALYMGEFDSSLHIRHQCGNTLCCNPNHMLLGTPAENIQDKVLTNRQAKGVNHGMSKLTDEHVHWIRELYKFGWTKTRIAQKFNISRQHVLRLVTHKNRNS